MTAGSATTVIRGARVFDGERLGAADSVLLAGSTIAASAGPRRPGWRRGHRRPRPDPAARPAEEQFCAPSRQQIWLICAAVATDSVSEAKRKLDSYRHVRIRMISRSLLCLAP